MTTNLNPNPTGEWLAFCEHVGLIDDNQMSVFGCKMAFLWYGLIPRMSP